MRSIQSSSRRIELHGEDVPVCATQDGRITLSLERLDLMAHLLADCVELRFQPFDVSRREPVEMNPLFGTPTFKGLPAKSKIQSHFLMFYTTIPDGFTRVDDVRLAGGKLTIEDRNAGKQVVLATSQTL